jgi:hypothetical protein
MYIIIALREMGIVLRKLPPVSKFTKGNQDIKDWMLRSPLRIL